MGGRAGAPARPPPHDRRPRAPGAERDPRPASGRFVRVLEPQLPRAGAGRRGRQRPELRGLRPVPHLAAPGDGAHGLLARCRGRSRRGLPHAVRLPDRRVGAVPTRHGPLGVRHLYRRRPVALPRRLPPRGPVRRCDGAGDVGRARHPLEPPARLRSRHRDEPERRHAQLQRRPPRPAGARRRRRRPHEHPTPLGRRPAGHDGGHDRAQRRASGGGPGRTAAACPRSLAVLRAPGRRGAGRAGVGVVAAAAGAVVAGRCVSPTRVGVRRRRGGAAAGGDPGPLVTAVGVPVAGPTGLRGCRPDRRPRAGLRRHDGAGRTVAGTPTATP